MMGKDLDKINKKLNLIMDKVSNLETLVMALEADNRQVNAKTKESINATKSYLFGQSSDISEAFNRIVEKELKEKVKND